MRQSLAEQLSLITLLRLVILILRLVVVFVLIVAVLVVLLIGIVILLVLLVFVHKCFTPLSRLFFSNCGVNILLI